MMLGNSELRRQILMYTFNSTLCELPKYQDDKVMLYSSLNSGV